MARILIVGSGDAIGSALVAELRANDPAVEVLGVETRPAGARDERGGIRTWVSDAGGPRYEEILEAEQPDAIVILPAWPRSTGAPPLRESMTALLESTALAAIRQVALVSTAAIYGASREGELLRDEAATPRTDLQGWLRDAAEADNVAARFLWRHPEIRTAILRPVHIVGHGNATGPARLLGDGISLTTPFFDPLVQLIHADDVAAAITLALRQKLHGVFHVAGPAPLPLGEAIHRAGGSALPLPTNLHAGAIRWIGDSVRAPLPGESDFQSFPCTVDDTRFRSETGFEHRWQLTDIFAQLKETASPASA